jgi:hypothetical protein
MAIWMQNLLAIAAVAACGGWALFQGVKSLSGKRSRLGSCCDKGCGAGQAKPSAEKVHFLPSDMLRKR